MEKFSLEKHWDGFLNGKIAVNCPTEELAKEFLQWCHSGGLEWCNGDSLLDINEFNCYEEITYGIDHKVGFGGFCCCDINGWEDDNYQVVEFCGLH